MPKANNKTNKKPTIKSPSPIKRMLYWGAVVGVWGIIAFGVALGVIAWGLPDVNQAISATKKPVV
ncbi:MAG: hypothetical protein KAI27_06530, partial [Rhodospirillaceae bacterium]|nr:hypothetical protein [Rhodospirillaceae bacterium]